MGHGARGRHGENRMKLEPRKRRRKYSIWGLDAGRLEGTAVHGATLRGEEG